MDVDYITVGAKVKKKHMLRFLSHMEYMRAIERTMRRANFPLWFTKGYHPRPKMSFPIAIPTGVIDLAGYFELRLSPELLGETKMNELVRNFNRCAPRGLEMVAMKPMKKGEIIQSIEYYSFRIIVEADEELTVDLNEETVMEYYVEKTGKFFMIEYLTGKEKLVRPDRLVDPNSTNGMVLFICTEAFNGNKEPMSKILEG